MSKRVTVNIYGTEYTISGGENQEKVSQIASYVDSQIRELAEKVSNKLPLGQLAILTSVNMADELLGCRERLDKNYEIIKQLESDVKHYMDLWEEAKDSFKQYRDENQLIRDQKEQLMLKINSKEKELERIIKGQGNIQEEVNKQVKAKLDEAEVRYRELENNFFDLQMENIRYKSELDKLKKDR